MYAAGRHEGVKGVDTEPKGPIHVHVGPKEESEMGEMYPVLEKPKVKVWCESQRKWVNAKVVGVLAEEEGQYAVAYLDLAQVVEKPDGEAVPSAYVRPALEIERPSVLTRRNLIIGAVSLLFAAGTAKVARDALKPNVPGVLPSKYKDAPELFSDGSCKIFLGQQKKFDFDTTKAQGAEQQSEHRVYAVTFVKGDEKQDEDLLHTKIGSFLRDKAPKAPGHRVDILYWRRLGGRWYEMVVNHYHPLPKGSSVGVRGQKQQ
jgi:hypothetical protein